MGKSYANWTFKKFVVQYLNREVTLTTFEEFRWSSIMLFTMTQAFRFATHQYRRCVRWRYVYAKGLLDYLVGRKLTLASIIAVPVKANLA